MTIDEAISIMNVIVHMLEPQYDTDRVEDAVEMAIKALEQQPTDAISRQAVLEQINCWIGSGEYKYTNATYYLTKRMQDLSPVSPKPKMGLWIARKDEYGDVCEDVCSCCGKNGNYKWKFCPFCGCKMQEVENA